MNTTITILTLLLTFVLIGICIYFIYKFNSIGMQLDIKLLRNTVEIEKKKQKVVNDQTQNPSDFLKALENYFETTPREKVLEDWTKSEEWDKVGPVISKEKYGQMESALNASVTAIYFSDSSDYRTLHYQVIEHLTGLKDVTDDDITRLFHELNPSK